LRGGAHLLYEVDTDVVFNERAESTVSELRKQLREQSIGYSRLTNTGSLVRIVLRDENDGENARKIIRRFDPNVNIVTEGATIDVTPNAAAEKQVIDQTIAQSIEIVRRRIDALGTTEPVIQRQGENRILVQAPGADAQSLKDVIGTTAKLGFHLVSADQSDTSRSTVRFPYDENEMQDLAVEKRAMIRGEMLDNAQPSFQDGSPVISFRLNTIGAKRFCDVTRKHTNEPFAIVLDEKILSAPVINEPICGGSGVISGGFSVEEAANLAMLLRSGALPAPMHVVEERTVGPSLGADSVDAGKIASIIGMAFVLIFMVVTYGTFGFYADIALMVNVALIFALLSSLQATLTLPGIAGIVLTIGMAVDANVLIFERIRDEFAAGRTVMSSIDAGYKQAMSTIIDSNLTTLIAALILFSFGTGPIKGFAVTLVIGIVCSFFSAVAVTRLLVVLWLRRKKRDTIPV
jgi:preprotein translocase subunit SecD